MLKCKGLTGPQIKWFLRWVQWGSEIWPLKIWKHSKFRPFEIWTSNDLLFKWMWFSNVLTIWKLNHSKSRLNNPDFKWQYWSVAILDSFQMAALPDFRSNFKSRPFENQFLLDISKSGHIPISNPHCIWLTVSKKNFSTGDDTLMGCSEKLSNLHIKIKSCRRRHSNVTKSVFKTKPNYTKTFCKKSKCIVFSVVFSH